jgi:hypothetical protein
MHDDAKKAKDVEQRGNAVNKRKQSQDQATNLEK